MDNFTPSPNRNYDRSSLLFPQIKYLFDGILKKCFPKLKGIKAFIIPLELEARKYGEYACLNVLELCQELSKKKRKPKDIAKVIIDELKTTTQNIDMISKGSIRLHDSGVITFKLRGSWIVQRLMMMLTNGIQTWAPVLYSRRARAVFISTNTEDIHVDMLRSDFIRDALLRIFLFSRIDVLEADVSPSNNISAETINKYGVYMHETDVLVYMAPHIQREHIQTCFNAARSNSRAILACCSYRIFMSDEADKQLDSVYFSYISRVDGPITRLAKDAGYTIQRFFAASLKFTFLKRHRLVECIFDIDDILDAEGNTFRYLLVTRALIGSVIMNSRCTRLFESEEALAGKEERELGFHLVQFTEVIEKACGALGPDALCEYLYDLCKLFTSYHRKVGKVAILGLCKAAKVVMETCFDLLGITPELPLVNLALERRGPCRELSEARNEHLSSRLELFSMRVDVADRTLDEFDIFGNVSVIDTYLARGNGWTMTDEKDCCFVSYFERDWYNPISTFSGSLIPFGDPSGRQSVPVSSSIEMHVLIHALSKNRDRYYKLCYVKTVQSISEFRGGDAKAKCGTFVFGGDAGDVSLNYMIVKEAVEASMELTYYSPSNISLHVCGSIVAYYGDGVVEDDDAIIGQLNAVVFRTKKTELKGSGVSLKMHKSVLAVPAGGRLKIEACLTDIKSKQVIVNGKKEYSPRSGDADTWDIGYGEHSFKLKVAWSGA